VEKVSIGTSVVCGLVDPKSKGNSTKWRCKATFSFIVTLQKLTIELKDDIHE